MDEREVEVFRNERKRFRDLSERDTDWLSILFETAAATLKRGDYQPPPEAMNRQEIVSRLSNGSWDLGMALARYHGGLSRDTPDHLLRRMQTDAERASLEVVLSALAAFVWTRKRRGRLE